MGRECFFGSIPALRAANFLKVIPAGASYRLSCLRTGSLPGVHANPVATPARSSTYEGLKYSAPLTEITYASVASYGSPSLR